MVLMGNLTEAEWINVLCDEQILRSVICMQRFEKHNKSRDENKNKHTETTFCSHKTVFIHRKCFLLFWGKTGSQEIGRMLLLKHKFVPASLSDLHIVKDIFGTIAAQFPLLMATGKSASEQTILLQCRKYYVLVKCEYPFSPRGNHSGFHVFKVGKSHLWKGIHNKKCCDGSHITLLSICDGKIDCPSDKSDEEGCMIPNKSEEPSHGIGQIHPKLADSCGHLKFTSIKATCVIFVQTYVLNLTNSEQEEIFSDDLILDVSENVDEEHTLKMLLQGWPSKCKLSLELPCREGHTKCFNMSDICVFSYDAFGHLFPCRNGGHLENCISFSCSIKFKCEESYCVPWTYVHDGKHDCPQGEDELVLHSSVDEAPNCAQMFLCQTIKRCILLASVCDEIFDCPLQDDEYLCQLKNIQCPKHCHCLALAIECTQQFDKLTLDIFVSVAVHSVSHIKDNIHNMRSALFLYIYHSNLNAMDDIIFPSSLIMLDVRFNCITFQVETYFIFNRKLQSLNMGNNCIKSVHQKKFELLQNMKGLNLSSNPLVSLPNGLFFNLSGLGLVCFENVSIKFVSNSLFESSSPKVIVSSSYQICCINSMNATCTASLPWFRSCDDLLAPYSAKIVFGLISSLVALVNVVSICVHLGYVDEMKKAYTVIAVVISTNNLLLSINYAILFAFDQTFGDTFATQDQMWRSGFSCFFSTALHLLFHIGSLIFNPLLSLARMMVVYHPITSNFKQPDYVMTCVIVITFVSVIFTVTFCLIFKYVNSELPLKLCLPLVDQTGSVVLATMMTWLLTVLQLATSATVVCMHIATVTKTIESAKNVQKSTKHDRSKALGV